MSSKIYKYLSGLHNIADRRTIGPRKFLRLAEKNGVKRKKERKNRKKENEKK
jgi:hypothetical protein